MNIGMPLVKHFFDNWVARIEGIEGSKFLVIEIWKARLSA